VTAPFPVSSPRHLTLGLVAFIVLAECVLMARIVASGFGADNDTYLMLGTWDRLFDHGIYTPSRFQGSPLAELSIGALSEVGGHWLSAAMSIALAVLAVWSLFDLAQRRLGSRSDAALLAIILTATPVFLVAASTSHDYIYGLALFLAGWNAQERGHDQRLVALILAMATMGRFSYVPLGAVVLLAGPPPRGPRDRTLSTAVYAVVIAVGYLPAYLSASGSFSIFTADRPTGQGLVGLVGRAVVKPTLLFGVVGMALLAAVIVVALARGRATRNGAMGERWLLVMIAITVLTWVWIPVEASYLLPTFAIVLVWLARVEVVRAVRPLLVVWLLTLVSLAWIEPQLVRYTYARSDGPCPPDEAVDVTFDPHVTRGQLLSYPDLVADNLPCNELRRAVQGGAFGDG
jgi:hypothetical protein